MKTRHVPLQPIGTPGKQVILRAAVVAIILGTILAFANQAGGILGNAEIRLLPLALAYLTPFLVIVLSQLFGLREARRMRARPTARRESFIATLISHGIPARAIMLGIAAAGANTAIMASQMMIDGGRVDQLPLALIVQALTLPAIFGALSQTLSLRRALNDPP